MMNIFSCFYWSFSCLWRSLLLRSYVHFHLGHSYSFHWAVWVPYRSWKLTPCQICEVQIFSNSVESFHFNNIFFCTEDFCFCFLSGGAESPKIFLKSLLYFIYVFFYASMVSYLIATEAFNTLWINYVYGIRYGIIFVYGSVFLISLV